MYCAELNNGLHLYMENLYVSTSKSENSAKMQDYFSNDLWEHQGNMSKQTHIY